MPSGRNTRFVDPPPTVGSALLGPTRRGCNNRAKGCVWRRRPRFARLSLGRLSLARLRLGAPGGRRRRRRPRTWLAGRQGWPKPPQSRPKAYPKLAKVGPKARGGCAAIGLANWQASWLAGSAAEAACGSTHFKCCESKRRVQLARTNEDIESDLLGGAGAEATRPGRSSDTAACVSVGWPTAAGELAAWRQVRRSGGQAACLRQNLVHCATPASLKAGRMWPLMCWPMLPMLPNSQMAG